MAIYYPPPQPFQPSPHVVQESAAPAADNPPFGLYARLGFLRLIEWWHVVPLPQQLIDLSPAIPGQSVDNPPVGPLNITSQYLLWAQPSWVVRAGTLSPAIPGQSIDQPGWVRPVHDLIRQWFKDPDNQYQFKLSPAIPGQSIDDPPRSSGVNLQVILQSWTPGPPQPPLGFHGALSALGTTDEPPYGLRPWLDTILRSWLADPQPKQNYPVFLSETTTVSDNPPFGLRQPLWPIIFAWQPGPPQPPVGIYVFTPGIPFVPGVFEFHHHYAN